MESDCNLNENSIVVKINNASGGSLVKKQHQTSDQPQPSDCHLRLRRGNTYLLCIRRNSRYESHINSLHCRLCVTNDNMAVD